MYRNRFSRETLCQKTRLVVDRQTDERIKNICCLYMSNYCDTGVCRKLKISQAELDKIKTFIKNELEKEGITKEKWN